MAQKQLILENPYSHSIDQLVMTFNSDLDNGIKMSEVEPRYSKYGYNELPKIKKSYWKIYLAPIFNFLIVILLISAIVIAILGSVESTIVTFVIVIVNSLTVIIQQFRAQKALESLKMIAALKATVIRGGIQFEIPNRELLPGDIILLEQGDKIPADARLLENVNLTIDEAPLTGESIPVEKNIELINSQEVPLQNQHNMVFMGTYVHMGRGKAIVTDTGIRTEIGKISNQLNEMGSVEDIPLTRKLNRLAYILGIIILINLVILIIYKFTILILEGNFIPDAINEALTSSILRAMNVLPINLPLLATLVLITGVLNMAQYGVIIRNLSAIESLGRVSVICSDKTGTITKNEMTVEKFLINDKEYYVTGAGYDLDGSIFENDNIANLKGDITFQRFIESCVMNNNAKLSYEDVKVRIKKIKELAVRRATGSPTEASLLVLAEKAGYIPYDIKKKYDVLLEFSFSSEFKRMTTICNNVNNDHENYAFSKGAPEKILLLSSKIEINGVIHPLDELKKKEILENIQLQANQGFRTLAVAYKPLNSLIEYKREEIERDLIFLSFVSIMDPPRPGVREAVKEAETGGIEVVMITGDHPATARTIASQMSIYQEGDIVVEGYQINSLTAEEFSNVSVFARVSPSDKEIIVDRYQSQNKVVSMTGDGINDTPALKKAQAGIAMGITGTDLAKETSDMVISDDNFTSIVKGVKTGRGLFAKIRSIIFFFICINFMEAAIFFALEFIPYFNLFSSEWQHIYIFGIVHSLPALALVVDTHPKDVMEEPPRDEEQLLNKHMWILLLIQAFLMGLGLVLALQLTASGAIPLNEWNLNFSYIPPGSTVEEIIDQKTRTMFITTLFIAESQFIWTFRRPNKSIIKSLKEEFSLILFIITSFTLGLHVLHLIFSYDVNYYINDVFGLNLQINFMFLSGGDWLICISLALIGILGIEVVKYFARKKRIIF